MRRSGCGVVGVVAGLIVLGWAAGAWAQGAPGGVTPTDAEIRRAMQRGVEFLLKAQKEGLWESRFDAAGKCTRQRKIGNGPATEDDPWPGVNFGGETGAVVQALLHAGQVLQEPRLERDAKDLQPAISFLSKLKPDATYTAGFQASALALVVQPDRPEVKRSLENVRSYLVAGMGVGGGYSYRSLAENLDLAVLWDRYCQAKASRDAAKTTDAKRTMDRAVRRLQEEVFGGAEQALQNLVALLNQHRKDPSRRAWAESALFELERYLPEARQAMALGSGEARRQLADARTRQQMLEDNLRTGRFGTKTDPVTKGRIPRTRDDVEADLANARRIVADAEREVQTGGPPIGDLSNAQSGTMGAGALEGAQVSLPKEYWVATERFWRTTQKADGTWPYNARGNDNGSPTMTLAGLASLMLAADYADTEVRTTAKPDKDLDMGWAWLGANFKSRELANFYYANGALRVGLNSGRKYFGTHNWYREGARIRLTGQRANGSWDYYGSENLGTAYALLFLARGLQPVACNKLEYPGNTWNARPRDAAHLVEWIGKELDQALRWQIVNLQADAADLKDAPVLLITGAVDPKFTAEEVAKLTAYVEGGGTIFSSADGAADGFSKAMAKYMAQVGASKYEPRDLPKDHPLFAKEAGQAVSKPPRLLGLSDGARELWVHAPQDFGASWQQRKVTVKEHFQIPAKLWSAANSGRKPVGP